MKCSEHDAQVVPQVKFHSVDQITHNDESDEILKRLFDRENF
jgi:hypothetical protein